MKIHDRRVKAKSKPSGETSEELRSRLAAFAIVTRSAAARRVQLSEPKVEGTVFAGPRRRLAAD